MTKPKNQTDEILKEPRVIIRAVDAPDGEGLSVWDRRSNSFRTSSSYGDDKDIICHCGFHSLRALKTALRCAKQHTDCEREVSSVSFKDFLVLKGETQRQPESETPGLTPAPRMVTMEERERFLTYLHGLPKKEVQKMQDEVELWEKVASVMDTVTNKTRIEKARMAIALVRAFEDQYDECPF